LINVKLLILFEYENPLSERQFSVGWKEFSDIFSGKIFDPLNARPFSGSEKRNNYHEIFITGFIN